jgi:hypothetical protein
MAFISTASAQPIPPSLSDISFLSGRWTVGDKAAAGPSFNGQTDFTLAADGKSLLVHDKASIIGADGAQVGDIDATVRIYPDGDGMGADYADRDHQVHYRLTKVTPGRAAVFDSDPAMNGAVLRLGYELTGPRSLLVTRGFKGQGQAQFGETTQTLTKADR